MAAGACSCFGIFFPASIPERSHPFPSRTRKLSSPGPMVLQGQPCGRVGRCRGFEGSLARVGLLSFSGSTREHGGGAGGHVDRDRATERREGAAAGIE